MQNLKENKKTSAIYPPMVVSSAGSLPKSDFGNLVLPLIELDKAGAIQLRLAMDFTIETLKVLKPQFIFVHNGTALGYLDQLYELPNSIVIQDTDIISRFSPTTTPSEFDTVTVIITTHNHPEMAIRCIESVRDSLQHNKTAIHVVIADNASTDPDLHRYLVELLDCTILWRPQDIGYIRSINDAIQQDDTDVITLNSDTIVHGNWVDRLREAAYSNERIATSTAISNSADAYSYPQYGFNKLDPALVPIYDDVVASVKCPEGITAIPIVHGFCAYYKRTALNDIGLFDDHAFDVGYGDEVDWSFRASERKWLHVLACNVYVGHEGSAIFKLEEKAKFLQQCIDIMKIKWVKYTTLMMDWFHKSDPLLPVRKLLDKRAGAESRPSTEKDTFEIPLGSDRVYIGFPHGNGCSPAFALSLVGLTYHDARNRNIVRVVEGAGGLYVATNRNNLVRAFLDRDCNWLFMLDSDIEFDKKTLYNLLDVADSVDKPIITGLYFGHEGVQKIELSPLWYEQVGNEEFSLISSIPTNSLVKLTGCGMGCALIHRSVLEKFPEVNDEWKWFGHDVLLINNQYKRLGEDFTFCRRARQLGFNIWGHSGVIVDHHKSRPENMQTFIQSQR